VSLALKVGCPCSGVGCDIASVFIFLCVGLMAIVCGVTFFLGFLSIDVYFVVSQSWCGVCRLLVEFLRFEVSMCVLCFRGCAVISLLLLISSLFVSFWYVASSQKVIVC
jgi:hypothetical protein